MSESPKSNESTDSNSSSYYLELEKLTSEIENIKQKIMLINENLNHIILHLTDNNTKLSCFSGNKYSKNGGSTPLIQLTNIKH